MIAWLVPPTFLGAPVSNRLLYVPFLREWVALVLRSWRELNTSVSSGIYCNVSDIVEIISQNLR